MSKPAKRPPANLQAEQRTLSIHSGPIPLPETLGKYEAIIPGAAERILSMAEQAAEHRRDMEREQLAAAITESKREFNEARIGQACAFVLALAFLAAGTWLANGGHEWSGSLLGASGIAGIVAAFIQGRKK